MIFEIESEFALAHRNPRRLAAPAAVDYLGLERQHFANHSHRFGRGLLFQARRKRQGSHADLEHAQH